MHSPVIALSDLGAVSSPTCTLVDVTWHDLSNLVPSILELREHQRALAPSDAWEEANAWTAELNYASMRLGRLNQPRNA